MDFFTVPTVTFRVLYVWFAIDHARRRILHFDVTEHPIVDWVVQQLRETFPQEGNLPLGVRSRCELRWACGLHVGIARSAANKHGVPEPLAERRCGTLDRQCAPRVARPGRRVQRAPPPATAERVRRLLSRRSNARRASKGNPRRPPPCSTPGSMQHCCVAAAARRPASPIRGGRVEE